jgi:OmpA-OmpF porin, OOP family
MKFGLDKITAGLLAGVVGLSGYFLTRPIEADIFARSSSLKSTATSNMSGLNWAESFVRGRDVSILGELDSTTIQDNAAQATKEVWGVRLVDNRTSLIPEAKPFAWSAKLDAGRMTFDGVLPPDGARSRIAAFAAEKFTPAKVDNRISHARGAPYGFSIAAMSLTRELQRLEAGEALLSGQTVTLRGRAPNLDVARSVTQAARAVPLGYTIAEISVTVPPQRPYAWSLERNAAGINISGLVVEQSDRGTLFGALDRHVANTPRQDTLMVAPGRPASVLFPAASDLVGRLTGGLKTGRIDIVDSALTITGEAKDAASYRAVTELLSRPLPAGLTLAKADIRPPVASPYVFNVARAAGTVRLTGYVPDEAARTDVRERVTRQFLGEKIEDALEIANGAPANFTASAGLAIDRLARLASGSANILDRVLTLKGEALTQVAADTAKSAAVGLPQGWRYDPDVFVKPQGEVLAGPACQTEISDLVSRGRMQFEVGSAAIYRDSFGLLDHLAFTMRRCSAAAIEIGGHTDSDGSPELNQDLSRRRAEAVADYLRTAGVEAHRISAFGYGPSRPVAPNDTDANKLRNRRIEFLVKP